MGPEGARRVEGELAYIGENPTENPRTRYLCVTLTRGEYGNLFMAVRRNAMGQSNFTQR